MQLPQRHHRHVNHLYILRSAQGRLYDPLNRLTSAAYSTGERYEYRYDRAGNRTWMRDPAGYHYYNYDQANRLYNSDGVSYNWDNRGNLTGKSGSGGSWSYTYNGAGRMTNASSYSPAYVYLQYVYNGDGLRVQQYVSPGYYTTRFTWDVAAGLPQVLATSDGALDLYGIGRIGEQRGVWSYPLTDGLGSGLDAEGASGRTPRAA